MNPICPHCKKPIPVEPGSSAANPSVNNPYFPFCSDRCKMADLYGWLAEQYRIPVVEQDFNSENRPLNGSTDAEESDDS